MIDYLLKYIDECELDYLKEQYTEEIIEYLASCKESVIYKIKELKSMNEDVDIYKELSENVNQFF